MGCADDGRVSDSGEYAIARTNIAFLLPGHRSRIWPSCGYERLNLITLESPNVMYDKQRHEAWLSFSIKRWQFRAAKIFAPTFLRQISVAANAYTEVLSAEPKELRRFQSSAAKSVTNVDDVHDALANEIRVFSLVSQLAPEQKLSYLVPVQRTV